MSGYPGHLVYSLIIFILIFLTFGDVIITPVSGEMSIGTIIETSGMVHNSFSGSWKGSDGNGTNSTLVYSDSEMTNGGNFSLNKQIEMYNSNKALMVLDTQKVLKYTSGESGGHLLADENIHTQSKVVDYFSEYPWNCSYRIDNQKTSFTVTNAEELKLSSISRYEDCNLDYSMIIGTKDLNNSGIGLIGNLNTRFSQNSESEGDKIRLYDRTYVSGLIESFNRMYHGGKEIDLLGLYSGVGAFTDKTTVEQYRMSNTSKSGLISGSSAYISDIITNGGNTDETRSIQVNDEVGSNRMVKFQSDGRSSIQAYEEILATQNNNAGRDDISPLCVLTFGESKVNSSNPDQRSSAETHLLGVSSAQIESSGRVSDLTNPAGLNLEYRADMQIPIGFDTNFVSSMKDLNGDGRYEDMNGNGRLDLNDLVLLFSNFRWISRSNISERIDYNNNNLADYADIVTLFKRFNLTNM